ncbi:RDD family protein [Streptomyces sp. H27-C3]|uniref:RDD family protein n=1 Tax=Streptomyces sp. H27-C3 TaxID=3046305 RepID=UPI0024B95928|nr:RDD family protein [Streptomyces sp. H27-C3]MDJ0461138.1 RDD family protein [Streptomyces sp. H27-C3]
MSTDQPPPGGQPPEDDPFFKKPQDGPTPPPPPPPPGGSPYGAPAGGSPYGDPPQGSSPYGGNAPPPPYSGGAADPLAGMPPLAPTGKRLVARIVDALIVGIPMSLLGWLIGSFEGYNGNWDDISDQGNGKSLLWQLITMIVYVGYDTYMTSRKNGQTVGKRLMGLRVAMLNSGTVPETRASLMRAVVLWVPALICCFCIWWLINLVMILVDKPYKQGLHDKAAKTVVVSAT